MKSFLTISLIFILITFIGYSQSEKGQFGIYGGLSMPQSEFPDDNFDDDSGFAKMGFCVGAEYEKPLNSPGLSWVTSVSVVLNSLDVDPIAEGYGEMEGIDLRGDAGSYINVPIMTGIKYQGETSPSMQMYAIAQVGLNYMKYPVIELKSDYGSADIEVDPTTSFGFAIGGGIIFNDKFNIGLRYLTFGDQNIDGKIKIPDADDEDIDAEFSLSMILITVGITLGK